MTTKSKRAPDPDEQSKRQCKQLQRIENLYDQLNVGLAELEEKLKENPLLQRESSDAPRKPR